MTCDCSPGTGNNSAGQTPALLAGLQNPVVLDFIGMRPVLPYYGRSTGKLYRAGGRVRQLCVDERDVPGFLNMRHHHLPIFQRAKAPARVEPVTEVATQIQQNVADILAELKGLPGVGLKTAEALFGAGYTAPALSVLSVDDASEVAAASGINLASAKKVIEGARQWAAVVDDVT